MTYEASTSPPSLRVRHVLVLFDGSEFALEAMPTGRALAERFGAELQVISVAGADEDLDRLQPSHRRRLVLAAETIVRWLWQAVMRRARSWDARQSWTRVWGACRRVAAVVHQCRGTVSDADAVVLRDPIGLASGIRAHLGERPAGLVAMTTHARSGMQRLMVDAAAANIVHASASPCLVVPVRR